MDLIINTFGTTVTKDTDNFVVVHKDGKQRVHPSTIKSISLSKGAQITSDAALLAIEHEIDVLFVDATGNPQGRIWSNKYGSVSTIRKNQLNFTFTVHALAWIKQVIASKLENQQALLLSFSGDDFRVDNIIKTAVNRIEDYRTKVLSIEGEIVSEIAPSLRGWEGAASKSYFGVIDEMMPEMYKFKGRTQHPATDVFNCLLNYGYGVLYGKVESALIKAGLDPYVGIMHRDDYNRPVLVFDVIEKFRIWIDYVVVNLLRQQVIDEDCYSVRDDGSYWLEALGKRILIQSLNDYFEELITQKGESRSRITHLNNFARDFAQMLLNFKG